MARKLTGEQVDYIRAEIRALEFAPDKVRWQRMRELAVKFSVQRSTIRDVVHRVTWLYR